MGHFKNTLLSCSSSPSLKGSNVALTILPVYDMCHQIHMMQSQSLGVFVFPSAQNTAGRNLGFCVNAVLAPCRWARSEGHSGARGQGLGLSRPALWWWSERPQQDCFFQSACPRAESRSIQLSLTSLPPSAWGCLIKIRISIF